MKRWGHDCSNCQFLGSVKADSRWTNGGTGYHRYDLYICPKDFGDELVARFGNDGPNYLSGSVQYPSNRPGYPLTLAIEMARKAGLA